MTARMLESNRTARLHGLASDPSAAATAGGSFGFTTGYPTRYPTSAESSLALAGRASSPSC